jgi:hypothetical protein
MGTETEVDIDAIMADLETDTTEIEPLEKIIAEIEEEAREVEVVVKTTTEVETTTTTNKSLTIDLDEENALSQRIVENSLSVIENARKVFTSFSDDVFHGKDKSTSSKEAMLRALDVQNGANKNMIDLAKVISNKDKGNGTNILINAVSEKQAGISLNNIRESL